MKDSMLSLDIYAWLQENREKIEGGFIKKIYQLDENSFLIKIYREGTQNLYINLKGWIYFGEKETPLEPSMFVMFLRKRFSGKKIIKVEQVNFDRIVKFIMGDGYELIFELFSEGNVIVVKDGIIERAYHEREWRHRAILKGEPYEPPPQRYHPLKDLDKLCDVINSSRYDVVRALALEFNMGKYAEEICLRAGVEKNRKGIGEEGCRRLREAIKEIFQFSGGYIYEDFFSPFPLKNRDALYVMDSFNEALKKYDVKKVEVEDDEIKRIRRRIEEQKKLLQRFEDEEIKARKIGDIIYEHFQEVSELLEKAKRGEVDYDRRRKILKVRLNGENIELDVNKSVGENASSYYEKAKKMREKVKGAMEAIKKSERELEERKKKRKREEKKEVRRRRFWFEKYRWFITSEDIVVIAGKDAKTNEEVVKKHLGNGDLYMHADIHGAPSVVIKAEGREVGEKSLFEAAQFAVSMSKAWNAGFGNLSAYWVYPSQVSKMGESGEYVARGSWVVHGRRNYIHHVSLKLGIGEIEYQGTRLVMCGAVNSILSRCDRYIIIEPGDIKKNDFAKEIAGIFNIPVEDALKILPPGSVRISEKRGY